MFHPVEKYSFLAFLSLMWPVDDIFFCQASLSRSASTQSQLVWASDICCCRPNCLELTERWYAWYDA